MKNTDKMFKALLGGILLLVFALTGQALAQGGTWATKASMPAARWGLSADAINGIIYVVGGVPVNNTCSYLHTLEAYDPATNTWSTKASMPTGRECFDVGVVNNILYAVGGGIGCGVYVPTVEAYDPVSDSWTTKAPMPTERRLHGVGVVNETLYVVGGYNNGGLLSSVLAYNPVTDIWTSKAPLPTPRVEHGVGVVNGVLYAVGGHNGTITFATVEAYDPVSNTWTTKAPMPRERHSHRVEVVNGILYALGGANNIGWRHPEVDAYNPLTNTWTTVASVPTPRTDHAVAVSNGVLYAVGGHNGNPLAMNEAFTPSYTCPGFQPPVDNPAIAIKVKKNRVIPLKAQLFDVFSSPVTNLSSPPAIQVWYSPTTPLGIDVTPEALSAGQGTEGNQFVFSDGKWQFNLQTKNYSSKGTYTVQMVPGGPGYTIDTTPTATFVIE